MPKRFLFPVIICVVFLSVTAVTAQDSVCTSHVISSISQLGTQCATTGLNEACYGTDFVTGSFVEESEPGVYTTLAEQDFFLEPGNKADLAFTQSLQSSPVDIDATPRTMGLSILNVQAGLPPEVISANGDKGALYFLFGDVIIEDAVLPGDTTDLLPAGIPMETVAATDMYLAPFDDDEIEIQLQVPASSRVNADAITPEGDWVRVIYQNRLGWIQRDALGPDADTSDLAEFGPGTFTPMQSFYFDNDVQQPASEADCENVPSLIFVQGPPDIPVYMQVNGVDVRLESTVAFHRSRDRVGEYFDVIGFSGMVTVFPNSARRKFVPPGFYLRLRLGDPGHRGHRWWRPFTGIDGDVRPLSRLELARFWFFPYIPRNILHYLKLLPRWIRASGIGGVIEYLIFENPEALRYVRRLCERDYLPDRICDMYNL